MGRFGIWRDVLVRDNLDLDLTNKRALANRMFKIASYAKLGGYAELLVSLRNLDVSPIWDVDFRPGYDERSDSLLVICTLVIEDKNKGALFRLWNPEYVVL